MSFLNVGVGRECMSPVRTVKRPDQMDEGRRYRFRTFFLLPNPDPRIELNESGVDKRNVGELGEGEPDDHGNFHPPLADRGVPEF